MLKIFFNRIVLIAGSTVILGLIVGCSAFRGPLYPDIIYNNRQPLISVTYEYGEIELILPIKYDAAVPDNILFKVFTQGDTLHPVISILQEAPKEFLAYLPQGVLDIQNSTNLIKILPQDSNFDPVSVRFKGIRFGRILMQPKTIRMGQLIVSGNTFLNNNDSTLASVDISLQSYDNIIHETQSNGSGYFQLAIPGEYRYAKHLRIVAGENLIFKPYTKRLDFSRDRKLKMDIGLGPSDEMKEPLYMTNKNNVHFLLRKKILKRNLNKPFWKFGLEKNIQIINDGGWHFNNLYSPEKISQKLKTFQHSEFGSKEFSSVDLIKTKIKKPR